MPIPYYERVHEGMEVLDLNGDQVGTAGATLGDHFKVAASTKDYYIPFSAIANVTHDGVRLSLRKDRIPAMNWNERPGQARTPEPVYDTDTMRTSDAGRTVQLRKEELHARKTAVETGSVLFGKEVVEQRRTIEVPLAHEEVYIERRPVDRRPSDRPISESGTHAIHVPVTEERVEIAKQPVVYEEVRVAKLQTQRTRQVADKIRREELREGPAGTRSANSVNETETTAFPPHTRRHR